METEIDIGRTAEFDRGEALVEMTGGDDALDHVGGDGLAGLPMQRETLQDLRLQRPMFIELRRKFDEIAGRRGSAHRGIDDIGQHAMQGMAEFVEQGRDFAQGQQGRAARRRFWEVHDIDDDRAHRLVECLLAAKIGHPGARPLRTAGVVIAEEDRDMAALAIDDLEGADVRMIDGEVGARNEPQAEQPFRAEKGCFDHVIELEIGRERVLIEIIGLPPQLFGIIAPIMRGDAEIGAFRIGQRLQAGAFVARFFARRDSRRCPADRPPLAARRPSSAPA